MFIMPAEFQRQGGSPESDRMKQDALVDSAVVVDPTPLSSRYGPGDLVDNKYRLERLIGRGGMGVVWEAHSIALDIRVAIKLIHYQLAATELQKIRLLREAKAAARLVDPGVVRVFDCGQAGGGEPYIVMELLEGRDLSSRLEQEGPMQPIEAVCMLLPIVRALGTAHAANVVHRDVKPENVFIAKSSRGESQPKLLDFGIAKVDLPSNRHLTEAGATLGSPYYMSPEQARGNEVDPRSDLWAICVVLYEAISGNLPFDGPNYNSILQAVLSTPVLTFAELGIDEPELWSIIARGLERDREQRWQSSEELAHALGAWLLNRGVLHDVTGVSLHATSSRRRASLIPTLEAVLPRKLFGGFAREVHTAQALAPGLSPSGQASYFRAHPRRYIAFMAMFALGGAILVWWLKKPSPAAPSALASSASQLVQSDSSAARAAPAQAPIVSMASPASTPGSVSEPSGVGSDPARPVASATAKAPKAKHQKAAPNSESFKSPFD
jgi:eukaryotic-like serine/threonine-protein kinase